MPAKKIKRTTLKKSTKARARTLRESAKPLMSEQPKPQVSIAAAKGRPMLTWVGKRPLRQLSVFPAQHIETFDPAKDAEKHPGGLLFHGDNKEVLAYLLANGYRGKVNLVYIDPPFDSGADYVRNVELRGVSGAAKLNGESYTLGEQIQYTDIWANDNYLQFMYERLLLLKELLREKGSILLHCDPGHSHHLRCLMDEVFGSEKTFKNEIIWFYRRWPTNTPTFQTMHDNIFWYTNSTDNGHTFNPLYEKASERTLSDYSGKRLTTVETADGSKVKRETDEESLGVPLRDVWEIRREHPRGHEHTEYPTQKPTELIERVLIALTNPGDLVLDCFIGSGTTAAVAQRLGRRWIGCDINKGAIQTTSKRLQTIIQEQVVEEADRKAKPRLVDAEAKGETPRPAQLSFAIYRVNDYDLQIQHNEAVNLACERIGITRTKSDGFFDGELGKRLAKIIPFNHPLTPLDLEEIKRELSARPSEERDIVVVCLGKELAVEEWLADWNRLRKGKEFPNKIEVIELRTDPKYGQFFEHKPASARVSIERKADQLHIEIKNFISPSIVERLKQQAGVLAPRIDDWRAMVDCVMIDTAYKGEVFNVVHSDVPEKKSDLVEGKYTLPAPKGKTTVAVKIVDMLGEEVLVVQEVCGATATKKI